MERAYVTQILDPHHAVVRIPSINKAEKAAGATPDDELAVAVIAAPSGTHVEFSSGDAVLVDFETEDFSRPIIVGSLFNQKTKNQQNIFKVNRLEALESCVLPFNTSIGDVTKDNLKLLKGLDLGKGVLLKDWIKTTESSISEHESKLLQQQKDIIANSKTIQDTQRATTNYASTLEGTVLDVALKFDTSDSAIVVQNVKLNPKDNEENESGSQYSIDSPPYTLNGLANSIYNVMLQLNSSLNNTVSYVDAEIKKTSTHSHKTKDIVDILIKSESSIKGSEEEDLSTRVNSDQNLKSTPDGAILFIYTE